MPMPTRAIAPKSSLSAAFATSSKARVLAFRANCFTWIAALYVARGYPWDGDEWDDFGVGGIHQADVERASAPEAIL